MPSLSLLRHKYGLGILGNPLSADEFLDGLRALVTLPHLCMQAVNRQGKTALQYAERVEYLLPHVQPIVMNLLSSRAQQ